MKFKPTESISAAELMNRLKSDPAWVQQNAEREAKHQASVAKLRTELGPEVTPLLAELATVGIHVACVSELINAKWSYAAAVSVLSKHLQKVRHPVLREMLARALTVKEVRGIAGRTILGQLQRADEQSREVRWALANALTEAADEEIVEEIKTLVVDVDYEDVHEILKRALKSLAAR